MAFYGCEFVYADVPCSEFGLMVYDFANKNQGDSNITSVGKTVTDYVSGRNNMFLYGVEQSEPLEFTLVFGVNLDSIDNHEPLDRYDIEVISAWLTSHDTYQYLSIIQPDLEYLRYKCLITELELVNSDNENYAFVAKVRCDSAYSYSLPEVYEYTITGSQEITLMNRSTSGRYYSPKLELELDGTNQFSIINTSDKNREFKFTDLPTNQPLTISIDNENQIITNNRELNLYPNFNLRFFRLVRGDNHLTISGSGKVRFICEFPLNSGA